MRIIRYLNGTGKAEWGVLDGDKILAAEGQPLVDLRATGTVVGDLQEARLLAPVTPSKIICVGRNYRSHAEEFGNPVPDEPLLFMKPPSAIVGPDADVVYPTLSRRVDPEAELVLVIGQDCHKIAAEDAFSVIGGYTCGNDMTARDIQKSDGQWTRGKGFDTFCPLGPWLETGEYNPRDVRVTCTVDGEVRQDGRTRDFIFDIPFLIAYITRFTRLLPGDVIMSGTPEGVRSMEAGQQVTVAVEGLGELTNTLVAES
ncbi:MAG: DUF2437 domain-containing protein [Nitriliruptorales bacterium]|nr:DUF2437 domain-containing protein [Nitriliruptorales bacterium]